MHELILALVGGAIGSIITLTATLGVRVWAARAEIGTNDRLVKGLDEDLERWVVDDHVRLKRELRDLRNDLNARNLFYSGEYGYQLGLAKERALHACRDQETRVCREAAAIHAREGWVHESWRQRQGKPPVRLTAPARIRPILDAWALPPSKHLSQGDEPPRVDNPIERTLEAVVTEIAASTDDLV